MSAERFPHCGMPDKPFAVPNRAGYGHVVRIRVRSVPDYARSPGATCFATERRAFAIRDLRIPVLSSVSTVLSTYVEIVVSGELGAKPLIIRHLRRFAPFKLTGIGANAPIRATKPLESEGFVP